MAQLPCSSSPSSPFAIIIDICRLTLARISNIGTNIAGGIRPTRFEAYKDGTLTLIGAGYATSQRYAAAVQEPADMIEMVRGLVNQTWSINEAAVSDALAGLMDGFDPANVTALGNMLAEGELLADNTDLQADMVRGSVSNPRLPILT